MANYRLGNLSLLYMDEGKCVIVRTIMVSPKFLVPSKEIKRAESPGLLDRHLLKNPFKALTMRSHESLPLLNKSEVSIGEEAQRPQSHLGPVVELGQLPLDSCVLGLSLRRLPDSVCGFLAISNEALVCYFTLSLEFYSYKIIDFYSYFRGSCNQKSNLPGTNHAFPVA
jgi:hypothetical protein